MISQGNLEQIQGQLYDSAPSKVESREYIWDLLDSLQDAVQVIQQWLFHTGKDQELGCSVHEARCLTVPMQGPEETLTSVCIEIPKKSVLILVKRCCRKRVDGLARGSEARQTRGKFSSSMSLCGLPPEVQIWGGSYCLK